jgi:hypothetical protein
MAKTWFVIVLMMVLLFLSACAPGPNQLVDVPDQEGDVAGFWAGLWHGLISPVTFVISLFSDQVTVFDVHNSGGWYSLGFLLGVSITFGGSGGGAASTRRK